ncbi:hypothetical protein GJAV_G00255170 [Gymnothorax javanicus]|nr:hypothetical protein GJAV_G00255170 [Gymnothorax javanicus]
MATSLGSGSQGPAPAYTVADQYIKEPSKQVEVCAFDAISSGHSTLVQQGLSGGSSSSPGPFAQDSPVKTSPVSERIKALEALVAKQSDEDTRNDEGFLLFKERHYEKSQTDVKVEISNSFTQKKGATPEQDSPESPFEVLEDIKPGSEFEDTVDWMRAHLPPAPDFASEVPDPEGSVESSKVPSDSCQLLETIAAAGVIGVDVPDAFMDSPTGASKSTGLFGEPDKQSSLGEDSEFDIRFLPTAFVCEKPMKTDNLPKSPSHAVVYGQEPPAPPAGFNSTPPPSPPSQLTGVAVKDAPLTDDFEPAEILEVDSSGESEDTVTEDIPSVPACVSNAPSTEVTSTVPSMPTEEEKVHPTKSERPLSTRQEKPAILVPIINVIETDEQVRSDEELEEVEEDEGHQVVEDTVKEAPKHTDQKPDASTSAAYDQSERISEVPPGPSVHVSDPTSQADDSSPSLIHSDGKTSPQYQSANESHTSRSLSAISVELAAGEKNGEQNSPAPKDPGLDDLRGKPPASDKNQIPSDPLTNSSLIAAETADGRITERLTDPLAHSEDVSADTQPSFLDSCSSDEDTQHASSVLPSLLTEKSKNDSLKEDPFQVSTLQMKQSGALGNFETDRLQAVEVPIIKTPAASAEDKMDKNSFSECEPQSYGELINQQISVPSEEDTTAKTINAQEDVGTIESEEPHPMPVGGQPFPRDFNQDPFSCVWSEPKEATRQVTVLESDTNVTAHTTSEVTSLKLEMPNANVADVLPHPDSVTMARDVETKATENSSDTTSDPESIEPECSVAAATDSFVEFMRECLKSSQAVEEPEDLQPCHAVEENLPKMGFPHSISPPAIVFDVEQEKLTIQALKELGGSQDDYERDEVLPSSSSKTEAPVSPVPQPPSPSHKPLRKLSPSQMADEVNEWVADAYHLAEHVLAAVLTRLSVRELVYWRDPKKTGVVFGTSLLLLLSLAAFSVISVVSYLLLALLCVTISFRIYKSVIQAVQKSNEGHPFKELMDQDVSIPPEKFRKHVDVCVSYVNRGLKHLSRLFLVEDLVDSLKLAVLMWLMTYVGAVFNGITILILADILLFTVPLVYEKNKKQIDHYLDIVRTQTNNIVSKVQDKLPGAAKRSKTE